MTNKVKTSDNRSGDSCRGAKVPCKETSLQTPAENPLTEINNPVISSDLTLDSKSSPGFLFSRVLTQLLVLLIGQTVFTPDSQLKGGWKTRSSQPSKDRDLKIPVLHTALFSSKTLKDPSGRWSRCV